MINVFMPWRKLLISEKNRVQELCHLIESNPCKGSCNRHEKLSAGFFKKNSAGYLAYYLILEKAVL